MRAVESMEQQIHFCTTDDDVRIAYATVGEGPPLVKGGELAQPSGIRLAQSGLASLAGGVRARSYFHPLRRARKWPV